MKILSTLALTTLIFVSYTGLANETAPTCQLENGPTSEGTRPQVWLVQEQIAGCGNRLIKRCVMMARCTFSATGESYTTLAHCPANRSPVDTCPPLEQCMQQHTVGMIARPSAIQPPSTDRPSNRVPPNRRPLAPRKGESSDATKAE